MSDNLDILKAVGEFTTKIIKHEDVDIESKKIISTLYLEMCRDVIEDINPRPCATNPATLRLVKSDIFNAD